jgi:hypothetical protein
VLIDLGASVNVTNEFGAAPLKEALSIKAIEAVDVLKRAGAKPPPASRAAILPPCAAVAIAVLLSLPGIVIAMAGRSFILDSV